MNENRMNESEENAVTIFAPKKLTCIVAVAVIVWKNRELYQWPSLNTILAFPGKTVAECQNKTAKILCYKEKS